MNIENDHPLGAIAFAEARGQEPEDIPTVEEIVLKKFEIVNEILANHARVETDPLDLQKDLIIFDPGTCSI